MCWTATLGFLTAGSKYEGLVVRVNIVLLSKAEVVVACLREALAPLTVKVCQSRAELLREMPAAEVLVVQNMGFAYHTIDAAVLARGRNLRLIQHHGVAWDATDATAAARLGIPVATISEQNSVAVAEQAFYLLLALAKGARLVQRSLEAGELGRTASRELAGKTLCIVGLGKIGRLLAGMARAFGMRVVGVKKSSNFVAARAAGVEEVYTTPDLHLALASADFIMLAIPLNAETFDIIGATEFAVMKPGVGLVNVSRGPHVNRAALEQALAAGKICGYAADVFWDEPANPTDPLLKDERVIITPHLGGLSREALQQCARAVRGNIDRLLQSEPLLNVVNGV